MTCRTLGQGMRFRQVRAGDVALKVTYANIAWCKQRCRDLLMARSMKEYEPTKSSKTTEWLDERQRPGNWIDVAESDEIPVDLVSWTRTLLHMFQIAFAPEIRRRLATGQLDENFFLSAAQLIQPEGGESTVRLNEEVRGKALVRVNRPVHQGEHVLVSDLQNFEKFDLEEDELDAGHFTLLWNGQGWIGSFDFRAGRAKSAGLLGLANQFLDVARVSAARRYAGPSVDNLFSACELVSKAHLILHRSPAGRTKSHGSVHRAINARRRRGNVNEDFVKLFNKMSHARSSARYDVGGQVEAPSQSDFQVVEREIEDLTKHVAPRVSTHDHTS